MSQRMIPKQNEFQFTDIRGKSMVIPGFDINALINARLEDVTWADVRKMFDISYNTLINIRASREYHTAIGMYFRLNVMALPKGLEGTFGIDREGVQHATRSYA